MGSSFGGRACVDPADLLAELDAAERWYGRANLYATGPGRAPGRGHLLLRKRDLDALDGSVDQTLTFSGGNAAHVLTLSPLTLLARECVTPGAATDADAVYLCEVADRRHLLRLIPLDRAYNLRTADGTGYQTQTLNAGAAWTWQQVVQDAATALGIGTLTLPFTPDAPPQNLQFWGHPCALDCLCDVLARLACDLAYDPVANTFAAVRLGTAADTYLDAITDGTVWDGFSAEEVRGWRPEKIKVRFMRRPVDRAAGYSQYHLETVTLPAVAGVEAGTIVQIDDDLSALGASGTPSNSAALATRAAERAADWLRKRAGYDRPVLVAWRDFVPTAAGLGGYAVRRVVFDDRGEMRTWAHAEFDGALEAWRPQGGWPVWWPITPGPAPAAPTALAATPSSGQTALTWAAPAGAPPAAQYVVQYALDAAMTSPTQFTVTNATSATVAGLTNGTTYYFGVYALDATGTGASPYSNIVSATPLAAPLPASATVQANGTDLVVTYSRAVSGFAAGAEGHALTGLTLGATALTYSSGNGTTSITFTISRTVVAGETGGVWAYTAGDIVGTSDSQAVANFSGQSVTNSSTQVNETIYTAAGADTFTPTFTGNHLIETWGGAGGASPNAGNGGGGGGYSAKVVALTAATGYGLVVGAAGVAAGDGGDTTFDTSVVVAKGGIGGGTTGIGGAAAAGTGTTKFSGGNGAAGAGSDGGGGGSSAGSGSNGNNGSGTTGGAAPTGGGAGGAGGTSGNNGGNGTAPGGGAGAGGLGMTAAGAAAPGKVRISWPA